MDCIYDDLRKEFVSTNETRNHRADGRTQEGGMRTHLLRKTLRGTESYSIEICRT
jgi:hypothetical protein